MGATLRVSNEEAVCVSAVHVEVLFRGNCWFVLQVGEGIPAELSIHRQLTYAVPPSSRKDAFLLPAHGQGM